MLDQWGFEDDSSVNPTDAYPYRREIISPPLKVHEIHEVKKVLTVLKDKISVNRSCGLHCHVEISGREAIVNALLIWRKIEGQVIKIFTRFNEVIYIGATIYQ